MTATRMPVLHRVLTSTVTAAAIAVSIVTMLVTGKAAPSSADIASADHVLRATPSARPTDAAVRPASVLAPSELPVSPQTVPTATPAPAGIRAAAVNAVTGSSTDVSTDVSPLAADGIPATALQAYQDAAMAVAASDPGCGIPWPLLAGIGRVESDHGRFAGATLFTNGTSSRQIMGPVLDGQGTAVITDTDGGLLDGDATYDRAMGPMQFIPGTWARYASDGNGDGVQDPFNIFDASLATAKYLCAAGGNLATTAGQVRAVFAYNHLVSYVNTVLALEHAYAGGAGVVVRDPPATSQPQAAPVTVEPVTSAPVTTKPVTVKPVQPVTTKPVQPVATKPVTVQPVTSTPIATKPAPPVATPPVTEPPVTEPPVTEPPVTAPPVAPVTPADPPTSTTPPTALTCPAGTQPIPALNSPLAGTAATPTPSTHAASSPTTTVTQLMPDGTPVPVGCSLVPAPPALTGAAPGTG